MTTYMYTHPLITWFEHITELVDGKPTRYYLYENKRWYEFKSHHEIPPHAIPMSYEEFVLEML